MKFLRNLLACLVALVLFSVLLIWIISSVAMNESLVEVKKHSVLEIKFDRPVTEREVDNPLAGMDINIGPPASIGLIELRAALRNAAEDDNIEGIYLNVEGMQAGITSIEEIRNAVSEFKSSGKFVYAYAKYYSEAGYYLASVADSIMIHPEGEVEFNGMAANLVFFKGALDKLEIEPEIFRVGDFKSAVEPFFREHMSPENELQMQTLLDDINDHMIQKISESRGLNADSLASINDHMLIRTTQDAKDRGLIDRLCYLEDFRQQLKQRAHAEDELELISYQKYSDSFVPKFTGKNKVAMLVASGEIVDGEGDYSTIGSETFINELRKIREDDDIKALVLRINSPGGSFIASDALWHEIRITAEKKPVVASMGDAAASGGYYLAMACDSIVANPTTITGSIGIFSVLFNVKGFLNNKLGITTDEVTTGEFSNMYSAVKPVSDRARQIIQHETELNYGTFVKKAAEGRHMTEGEIRSIASGRVWSGEKGLENGLVDVLGDTEKAVELAATMAGVEDDYRVRYYPEQKGFFEMLFGSGEEEMKTRAMKDELGIMYPYIQQLKDLEKLEGVQARVFPEIKIN